MHFIIDEKDKVFYKKKIKLLTLIEEERQRRKLKCGSGTSYNVCFV